MIIQKPVQLKDSLRWRMIETSDEDQNHFVELCPCTLGHSYEFQAVQCAKIQTRLRNPFDVTRPKCYGCKHYGNALENTKFTRHGKESTDVFHGILFREWCERPELQSEDDDYNEVYAERTDAETICADEDYAYFSAKENQ